MEKGSMGGEHRVVLSQRKGLEITGVEEVESFDDCTIIMSTNQGNLVVRGEELHIETLSLDGGALKVEGRVDSLTYEETRREKGGLWSRLLH